jgi:hypothetical protein
MNKMIYILFLSMYFMFISSKIKLPLTIHMELDDHIITDESRFKRNDIQIEVNDKNFIDSIKNMPYNFDRFNHVRIKSPQTERNWIAFFLELFFLIGVGHLYAHRYCYALFKIIITLVLLYFFLQTNSKLNKIFFSIGFLLFSLIHAADLVILLV